MNTFSLYFLSQRTSIFDDNSYSLNWSISECAITLPSESSNYILWNLSEPWYIFDWTFPDTCISTLSSNYMSGKFKVVSSNFITTDFDSVYSLSSKLL